MQKGSRINNTTTFSTTVSQLRTDEDFRNRRDRNYHKSVPEGYLSLETLGIKMVKQFPLDPMHLVDLGVVKKILLCILKGKTKYFKLNTNDKNVISERLLSCVSYIPKEFASIPRSADEIAMWKATEFRQFILYTGIAVLKDIVPEECYYHFCLLYSAYRLLYVRESFANNIQSASDMLTYFVENFSSVYSEEQVSYNVHSLLHLTQCVQEIGFINSFSAYPFENYMKTLKRYVKRPSKILEQIHTKIEKSKFKVKGQKNAVECKKDRHGKIIEVKTSTFCMTLKSRDKYCSLKTGVAVGIENFAEKNNEIFISAKRLLNRDNLFTEPVSSMDILDIFISDSEDAALETYSFNLIAYKLMHLPFKNTNLFIPIIHTRID